MTVDTTFEARLNEAFAEYVLPAPVDVDPQAVTASVAQLGRRRWFGLSSVGSNHRWLTPVVIGLLLVVLTIGIAVVGSWLLRSDPAPLPYTGVFVPATDMSESRTKPTLTALVDGRVLISGGSPAEVYDPATDTTQVIPGDAPTGETNSAVLLKDGRVFLINYDGNATSSRAWIFDPATMLFHDLPQDGFTSSPPFGVMPGVALLPDGKVLVAGGTEDVYQPILLASAMIFDPETESFSPTGSMTIQRRGHSMTSLHDGRILVAGGSTFDPPRTTLIDRSSAEIYDPRTGTFIPTADMAHVVGATESLLLADDRVLVYSAAPPPFSDPSQPRDPTAIDLYDPTNGTFTDAGSIARAFDDATLLRDGSILLSGADHYTERQDVPGGAYYLYDLYRPWAAIYDPWDRSLDDVAPPRTQYPGTLSLTGGRVLFAGGVTYPTQPQSAGAWDPVRQPWMEIFE